ncbi:MAG: signal peptidase II [Solirubrobacterales bacterium]
MSSAGTFTRLGLIALLVLAVDQAVKAVIVRSIERGELENVAGPLDLTLTYNDGIAFGLASGGGPLVIFLALVALVALGFFVASAPPGWPTAVAGGLILGGALGNLLDRLTRGEVVDFVSVPFWPAFNLADTAITVGVISLAIVVIRSGRENDG